MACSPARPSVCRKTAQSPNWRRHSYRAVPLPLWGGCRSCFGSYCSIFRESSHSGMIKALLSVSFISCFCFATAPAFCLGTGGWSASFCFILALQPSSLTQSNFIGFSLQPLNSKMRNRILHTKHARKKRGVADSPYQSKEWAFNLPMKVKNEARLTSISSLAITRPIFQLFCNQLGHATNWPLFVFALTCEIPIWGL